MKTTKPFYANIYLEDRAYGGPEEGGIWYNYREPCVSIKVRSRREAETVLKRLTKKRYSNKGMKPIWSVNSIGQYIDRIERKPAQRESDYVPYE
ncbi:hypothetical protein SEA_WOFFORD_277 [Streptomyces phage Wofford]|uniref:Uncharacterized protein n=1 Tax=Streptomyces phage Wofford TaxID=2283267 RepID=A0A345M9P6_9CAUD|nr:hypothetical protein HWB78_gp019 [Streptomyces phage Wollford]YP_009839920.1 hypothetical protein HWB78_gp042 [Streptomyces phage Wollford]AXH67217.1 hypothetical protein SEA_WOFFORD_19 [Streptomyces phage Wollford]AXH67411.1 hypothetical protein SEA_WOFFORD_277 [Streptomyces phage Wollford]